MYKQMKTERSLKGNQLVFKMEEELFAFLNVKYQVNDIQINQSQYIHSVFVPSFTQDKQNCENYYVGHGFGGSSLMNFGFLKTLLKKGNVIFWEIRGMGLGTKLNQYLQEEISKIQEFFLKTIEALFTYYDHKNCSFICHSLSSYLLLLYIIRFPIQAKNHIKTLLLLSPIGITTKEEDYKNYINGCSDIFHTLLNKFGWTFKLTYKSILRTICSCCKKSVIMSRIKDIQMSESQKQMMCRLVQTCVLLTDGSQSLFFNLFEPRVLPKIALEPLITVDPMINIIMVYGGNSDWVDKTGAKKISQRFPNSIHLLDIEDCGHNIPLDATLCRELFQKYL